MVTLNKVIRDPHKSLNELEKELGAQPGELLREMNGLAEEAGDWARHLPSGLSEDYFENLETQRAYGVHVNGCAYCQRLLDSLQPLDLQTQLFVTQARRAHRGGTKGQ